MDSFSSLYFDPVLVNFVLLFVAWHQSFVHGPGLFRIPRLVIDILLFPQRAFSAGPYGVSSRENIFPVFDRELLIEVLKVPTLIPFSCPSALAQTIQFPSYPLFMMRRFFLSCEASFPSSSLLLLYSFKLWFFLDFSPPQPFAPLPSEKLLDAYSSVSAPGFPANAYFALLPSLDSFVRSLFPRFR